MGSYFSLPNGQATARMDLFSALSGPSSRTRRAAGASAASSAPSADDIFDSDVGIVAEANAPSAVAPAPLSRHMFFRMVNKQPGLKKLGKSDDTVRFGIDQFIVTRHNILDVDHSKSSVTLGISPDNASDAMQLLTAESVQDATLWEPLGEGICITDPEPLALAKDPACNELLGRLVSHSAFPGTSTFLTLTVTGGEAERARAMIAGGTLAFDPSTSNSELAVQLSAVALQQLRLGIALGRPRKPLQVFGDWSPKWTSYECLESLRKHDWRCASACCWGRGQAQPYHIVHTDVERWRGRGQDLHTCPTTP